MKPTILYPLSVIAALFVVPTLADEASTPMVPDTELATAPAAADTAIVSAPDGAPIVADATIVRNPKTKFPRGMQIGVGVSATSGLNGFVGYANKDFDSFWWKRFGFRVDFASTRPIKSAINSAIDSAMGDDGIDIGDNLAINDGAINAHHAAALVDFYPFGNTWFLGGIRLTGGYYTGKLDIDANLAGKIDGLPSDSFEFKLMNNLYRYTGNGVRGNAHADWKYSGPYLGTGFDLGLFAGFKIYMDAGVVFTNKSAQLSLDVPFDGLQQFDAATNAWQNVTAGAMQDEVERVKAEALADAQHELDDNKFYPMVKLGFMYRF